MDAEVSVRRAGSIAALVLLAGCAGAPRAVEMPAPGQGWTGSPLVATRGGPVLGVEDSDDTWVWRGVPYARPPVGELRWRAPRDPEPWDGVLVADRFGSPCTQYLPLSRTAVMGSEDCLTLNVWRPRGLERGLPVYVWIHGGGNSIGSSAMVPDYHGHGVASRSRMVFVSVNYRLGPLGWFAHPALAQGESAEDASGNYGTLDLIHALRWIRDNVGSFGGDPARVLIAGESAGAMNVLSLLIAPAARGLFSHALAQSGLATTRDLSEAHGSSREALVRLVAAARRIRDQEKAAAAADAMSDAQIAVFLREQSARDLLRVFPVTMAGMTRNPAILRDGTVIPREGFGVLATRGASSQVPMLIGSNREEAKLFLFLDGSIPPRNPLYSAVARWRSELWKADGVDRVARAFASLPGQPGVYVYRFDWGSYDPAGHNALPGGWARRLGAFHTLEIPFFLGTDTVNGKLLGGLLFNRRNQSSRDLLSDAMMRYVASFVRTGDPNPAGGGLPVWSPWSAAPGAPKTLLLDSTETGLAVRMTDLELTPRIVEQTIRSDLDPGLYEEARRRVEASGIVVESDRDL